MNRSTSVPQSRVQYNVLSETIYNLITVSVYKNKMLYNSNIQRHGQTFPFQKGWVGAYSSRKEVAKPQTLQFHTQDLRLRVISSGLRWDTTPTPQFCCLWPMWLLSWLPLVPTTFFSRYSTSLASSTCWGLHYNLGFAFIASCMDHSDLG